MKKIYWFIILIFLLIVSSVLFFNSKYFIELNGEEEIIIGLNEEYIELGAQTLFKQNTKIIGTVDNTKIGTYEIRYYYLNKYRSRKVIVLDKEQPKIELNGAAEVNVVVNSIYYEQGYTATDNYDGDITDSVKVNSNLDISMPGVYEITYEVSDSSNNKAKVKRIINVNEKGPLSLEIKDFSLDGYFTNTILKENNYDNNYLNDTIFYGDSITENFAYYGNLDYQNVWAVSNLTPINAKNWNVMFYKYNEKINIIDGFKKYQPKRVIITLGANAIIMDKNYFIEQYEDLIISLKEASPKTIIIVQSIFPVDDRWDRQANLLNNTKINNLNYLLAQMCEKNDIKFLNTAEVLKSEDGTAKKGYLYESDGIHPLPFANEIIIDYVINHQYMGVD